MIPFRRVPACPKVGTGWIARSSRAAEVSLPVSLSAVGVAIVSSGTQVAGASTRVTLAGDASSAWSRSPIKLAPEFGSKKLSYRSGQCSPKDASRHPGVKGFLNRLRAVGALGGCTQAR